MLKQCCQCPCQRRLHCICFFAPLLSCRCLGELIPPIMFTGSICKEARLQAKLTQVHKQAVRMERSGGSKGEKLQSQLCLRAPTFQEGPISFLKGSHWIYSGPTRIISLLLNSKSTNLELYLYLQNSLTAPLG